MTTDLDLVVIIPVYNGALTIIEQLEALAEEEWEGSWEVLVVDNGSTDGTAKTVDDFAQRHPGRFRLVAAADRHNLSYVRNEGVRLSDSRWIAFCDADDVIEAGWVSGITSALLTHQLVGSRLEYVLLNSPSAGARQTYQTRDVGSIFGVPEVAGGGLGCWRSLWQQLGGNDERMLAEDTDFSVRAHLRAGVSPVLADATYHVRLRDHPRAEFKRGMRQARAEVQMFKSYGSERHRPSGRSALRRWKRAVSAVGRIRSADGRLEAARLWGGNVGRIHGSITYRTRYL